jgi:outer membrane lipoprotein carrier protein
MSAGHKGYGLLFALLCILLTEGVWAADDLEALRKSSHNINMLSAEFIQEKHLRIMAKPIVSRGRFYYKSPRFIRWEYLAPVKHVMLMNKNGASVYIWSEGNWVPDKTQGAARTLVLDEINRWITGRFNESTAFSHTYKPGPPPFVILKPKEELKRFIEQITVRFPNASSLADRVEITEDRGNRTDINFRHVQLNTEIEESLFEKP